MVMDFLSHGAGDLSPVDGDSERLWECTTTTAFTFIFYSDYYYYIKIILLY